MSVSSASSSAMMFKPLGKRNTSNSTKSKRKLSEAVDQSEVETDEGDVIIKLKRTRYSENRSKKGTNGKGRGRSSGENLDPQTAPRNQVTVDASFDDSLSTISSITADSPKKALRSPFIEPVETEADRKGSEYWKAMFEQLLQVRETEPERLLREQREAVTEREASMNLLIQSLQEKIEWVEEQAQKVLASGQGGGQKLDDSFQEMKSIVESLEDQTAKDERIAVLEAKVSKQRNLLRLYQQVSSLVMTPYQPGDGLSEALSKRSESESEELVTCIALNHIQRKVAKFNLSILSSQEEDEEDEEDEVDEVQFTPVGNLENFPSHMRSQISFSMHQAPVFLQQLLSRLYKEED